MGLKGKAQASGVGTPTRGMTSRLPLLQLIGFPVAMALSPSAV